MLSPNKNTVLSDKSWLIANVEIVGMNTIVIPLKIPGTDNTNIGTFTKGDKKYLSIGNKSTLYGELLISDTPNVSDIKIDKSKVQSSGEEFKNSMTGIFKTSVSFVLRSVFGEEVGKAIADYIM